MRTCYDKLWKLMIDRKLMKKDVIQKAGITTNAMAKMGKEENVSIDVLGKICKALNCRIEDIVDFVPDNDRPHLSCEGADKNNGEAD